jgi:hypothetical protein
MVLGTAGDGYAIVFDDGRISIILTPSEAASVREWLNYELGPKPEEPESLHDE